MSNHIKLGPYTFDPHPEMTPDMVEKAVKDGLNDIMPTVMGEIEGMVADQIGSIKDDLGNLSTTVEPLPSKHLTYEHGLRVGFAIGACLFIGLLAGLLIGKI